MQLKKLLALLLSAALALSLLAGCGGESVARSLLALLDGKYANVSVEMDPDLEADLRQAIRTAESENAGDDAAAIRAALETLLGSKVTFRKLGEGQQGDTAFDLIFYAGADPGKAAQSAYSQWNGTFSNLPDDGLYTAALAQVQTENGVWMLVKATVEKAGTVDKPDKDDDEPEKPKQPYEVTGTNDDGQVTKVTVNASNGLENLFTKQEGEAQKIADARDSGFKDVTIELAAGSYSVDSTFTTAFKGTLQGKSPDEKATINIAGDCNGLFQQIESNGKVENITFEVQTDITNTYAEGGGSSCAGAVAGINNGNITNCDVTINNDCTIQATASEWSQAVAGGLVGLNYGTITDCTVTINGSISVTDGYIANAGGIAGGNWGKIEGVTIENGGSIQATGGYDRASAGGLAGESSNGTVNGTYKCDDGTITAKVKSNEVSVPDSVASVPDFDNSDKDDNLNTDTQGEARAGTMIGYNWTVGSGGPVS